MNYENDLRLLKCSFCGGGEGRFYLHVLKRLATLHHLDWLDIGIGRDGSALRPFIDACKDRGQTIAITGVDPDAEPVEKWEDGVHWRLLRKTFQEWRDDGNYDVINVDQAFYYLGDPRGTLKRALKLLRPGGLFIATCWSRKDALYRLHRQLFSASDEDLVGEDLFTLVYEMPGFIRVETASFENSVHLHAWREDCRFLEPALRVIARRPLDTISDPRPEALLAVLGQFPDVDKRINIAICASRAEM